MSLFFKPGVVIRLLSQPILLALIVADEVYDDYGYHCVITSMCDGTHRPGSLHYIGHAVDLRTRHIDGVEIKRQIAARIRERLMPLHDFDVLLEDEQGANEHIHLEYQPKGAHP